MTQQLSLHYTGEWVNGSRKFGSVIVLTTCSNFAGELTDHPIVLLQPIGYPTYERTESVTKQHKTEIEVANCL